MAVVQLNIFVALSYFTFLTVNFNLNYFGIKLLSMLGFNNLSFCISNSTSHFKPLAQSLDLNIY